MKNTIRNSATPALIATMGVLLSLAAAGSWAGQDGDQDHRKSRKSEACYKTTSQMKKACEADITDDYYTLSANCLNSEEPKDCMREAKEERRLARKDCDDQAEGRDNLCDRLPDAGPYITAIDPLDFDGSNGTCWQDGGQNRYFPLVVGTVSTFVNEEDEETIIVTVTDETREILGVETIIVRDTVYEGLPDDDGNPTGDRIEDTDDYYAIDRNCSVWYFGEVSQSFEDGYLDNLDGSFIAGIDEAQAGIIMQGDPQVGDVYRQEFALGDAEDAAEVLSLSADVELSDPASVFSCDGACLKSEDFIANDPEATEFKFFKPGVGFVAEQLPGGEVVLELISVDGP